MKMNWIRKCVSGIGSSDRLGIGVAALIYTATVVATFVIVVKYQMAIVAPYLCTGGALLAFLVARIIIETLRPHECHECGKLYRKKNLREQGWYDCTLRYCKKCDPESDENRKQRGIEYMNRLGGVDA